MQNITDNYIWHFKKYNKENMGALTQQKAKVMHLTEAQM